MKYPCRPSANLRPEKTQSNASQPCGVRRSCRLEWEVVEIIREIGGSPHILLEAGAAKLGEEDAITDAENDGGEGSTEHPGADTKFATSNVQPPATLASGSQASGTHRPIFVAHGKNKAPLQQLQALLTSFQIPHKVVVDEAHLGRPISQKVRDTLRECGSAILIFTRDEQFIDKNGVEIWRPSENVIYELGATSYLYGDRIVIFKEKGIHFPTNFQNIGYIEFESNDIQARTADLLKELIGFGLVRVTPT